MTMTEIGITKNQIIQELTRSPHGKLAEYVPVGAVAQRDEPEFFAHLIAWNNRRGQILDAKLALPVIALSLGKMHDEFRDNAVAHMCTLDPRNFLRSLRFSKELRTDGHTRFICRAVEQYLRVRENNPNWWRSVAVQNRRQLKTLYAMFHVKPMHLADFVLFHRHKPAGSVFEAIAQLKNMSPMEAAGTIMELKIPFLVAVSAIGKKADPDLALAIINSMSPSELVTNAKSLERLGIKTNPVLRSAFELALSRAARGNKNILKTTVAAGVVDDEATRSKLRSVQEKQMQAGHGIDGNWLVLGDKSASMQKCIETSRQVAATLAKMVRGKVHLVFFDVAPRYIDATGKTYDALLAETKHVEARGGTSIGCGLMWALENGVEVDGIAIVSDAAENNAPTFARVYQAYSEKCGKQMPVYLYRMALSTTSYSDVDLARSMAHEKLDMQEFDLRGRVDYYSLPNIVATMRANRYSLIDEIMATSLLTMDEVFK